MSIGKGQIAKLNTQNRMNHENYLSRNRALVTKFQNAKDEYNNIIAIINSEKVSMRKELRQLYDFLDFIGGSLERKISIIDFVEEAPANNITEDVEIPVPDEYAEDLPMIVGAIVNKMKASEFEKKIYWKTIEYKKNLKTKEQAVTRMKDCVDIAKIYRNMLVTLRDAIGESIIPEFKYIETFLIADAIREKYYSGELLEDIRPNRITEYKDTKYNMHYRFVRNTFDFWDLCNSLFSRPILTELMQMEEITEQQREEFNQRIYEIQDELALLEKDMEVSR